MPHNETLLFILFNLFILFLLALDLGVFHRREHAISVKEAAAWSVAWIVLSLLFNVALFFWVRERTASTDEALRVSLEFLAGYLLEKSLSVDNIFVFVLIFNYFGVPGKYQHTVLFWGVIGALVFRSIFIATGVALISRFEWVLYIFGLILIYSGWKMLRQEEMEVHPDKNPIIRAAKRMFRVETGYATKKFIVWKDKRLHVTTLFLVLLTVETTDIVFAVDSIPAVFGVTRDPFIVYSSNVFAILGLRALYFLLAGVMRSFYYLKHGLSLVLIFIGIKMLIEDFLHVPIGVSLGVIAILLAVSILASLRKNRMEKNGPSRSGDSFRKSVD
jgi:tellurite resistance protein TerC